MAVRLILRHPAKPNPPCSGHGCRQIPTVRVRVATEFGRDGWSTGIDYCADHGYDFAQRCVDRHDARMLVEDLP